jgi:hypothetical protein
MGDSSLVMDGLGRARRCTARTYPLGAIKFTKSIGFQTEISSLTAIFDNLKQQITHF